MIHGQKDDMPGQNNDLESAYGFNFRREDMKTPKCLYCMYFTTDSAVHNRIFRLQSPSETNLELDMNLSPTILQQYIPKCDNQVPQAPMPFKSEGRVANPAPTLATRTAMDVVKVETLDSPWCEPSGEWLARSTGK